MLCLLRERTSDSCTSNAERCTFNQTKGPVGSVFFFQKGGVLFVVNKEMLTRQLLALDGIEPDGDTEIRKIRKESIHSVNMCLSLLDSKVRDMTTDHDGSSDRMDLAELTKLNTEMLNSARELLRIKTALKKLMNI